MALRPGHRLDIYDADLYLTTTKAEWRALARKIPPMEKTAPAAAGQSTVMEFEPNDGGMAVPVVVLWIDLAQHKAAGERVNTCAHEAVHAAGQLLDRVGHKYEGEDEPHAYLVGWLTQWIWDQLPASED